MANVIKHKRGSGSDPVASDLVVGEVAIRTDVGKLFTKMDNGSVAEIAGGGSDIAINTLSSSSGTGGGSATFNGSAYRFTLSQPPSVSAQQLLVSINGVIQKPVAGTGQPSEGFSVDGTDIILGDAPATGSDFFILTFKSLGVSEPADNSVTSAKIVDGAIVNADINASAAIAGTKISPSFGSQSVNVEDGYAYGFGDNSYRIEGKDDGSNARIGFVAAGSEKMRIDSSGNVGIGTASPAQIFHVKNTGAHTTWRIENDNADFLIQAGDAGADGLHFYDFDNTAYRMTIANSGNIGIGTTSPLARLHVLEDVYAKGSSGDGSVGIQVRSGGSAISNQHQIRTGGGTGQQLFIEALGSSSAVVTKVNGSERMRIDSSGRLLIGTTTSAGSATDLKLQAFHPSHGSIILGSSDVSATGTATINFAPSNKVTGSQIVCTAEEDFSTSANRTARLSFSTRKDGTLREHLRITASGHVKATSEAGTYQTSSGNFHESYTNTNTQHIHWFQHNGNTQAQQYGIRVRTGDDGNDGNSLLQCSSGSATAGLILRNGSFQSRNNSFGGVSDIKLKENIVDAKSQWDDIKAIKFRNFNFIDNPSKKMLGVVAQEIELVSAGLVEDIPDRDPDTNEDLGTVTKHVKSSILYMKAIKCLQEAMAKIEVLEAKVTTLEAK